jgi:hypothetical protein
MCVKEEYRDSAAVFVHMGNRALPGKMLMISDMELEFMAILRRN